jgi:hypothetical protein
MLIDTRPVSTSTTVTATEGMPLLSHQRPDPADR